MNAELLKRSYLGAAVASAGIVGGIVLYAVVVEVLAGMGHRPPLTPPAAFAAKYALYLLGVSALFLVRPFTAGFDAKRPTPEATVKALTAQALIRAGLCELPAIAGLILYVLTGYRADFYLLIVFAAGLEVYHFPRLSRWEERLRSDFGLL